MTKEFDNDGFGDLQWNSLTRRLLLDIRLGRQIDFPKGDHRRPPAFFMLRLWARPLGFIDSGYFSDFKHLRRLFAACWGCLGSLLGPLEGLLGGPVSILERLGASFIV